MPQFELRLAGGRALLPGLGLSEVDVLVADGKTAGFCQPTSTVDAAEVVSIPGLTVLPGAIDPHVHLGQDLSYPRVPEDITLESAAAAAGGVTTFLGYVMSADPYEQPFEGIVKLSEENSLTDFGFHFCICSREQLRAVPHYAREFGVSSFKFYMNFRGDEGRNLGIPGNDDGFLFELLQEANREGGLVCPHTENIELVWRLRERVRGLDLPPLRMWYETRPPYVEAEAMHRVAYLAGVLEAPVYAVHISSAEALNAALMHRTTNGRPYIETCPHFLTHDVDSEVGVLGKVNPPLRMSSDREILWEALRAGSIDAIGSDHSPRIKAKKSGDIWTAAAAFPGLETLLPILVSEGHVRRGIPLERIVEAVSTRPARIFGLYPRKGVIAVGSDADFAIVDLNGKRTLRAEDLHSQAGFSLYEGWEVSCRVAHTLVRGTFVLRDGAVQPLYGHGKYHPRHASGTE